MPRRAASGAGARRGSAKRAPQSSRPGIGEIGIAAQSRGLAAEDLLAHIVDLACARGAGALATLGAGAAVAARTDDARRRAERIADPGDVQHVGNGPQRLAGGLRYARLAASMQAFAEDGLDHGLARHAVGGERR